MIIIRVSPVTRVGKTEPLKATCSIQIISNANMNSRFYLVGILPKLNIHLSGAAFKWPDSERNNKLKQFEDINHDVQNKCNPEKQTMVLQAKEND